MKKQILFIASLFTAFSLSAQTQIPNSSFESWSTDSESKSEQPTFWIPATDCDFTPCLVYSEKTTDSRSGSAVKITAKKDSESGEISTMELSFLAYPFNKRPFKLTFWYKSTTFFVGGINLGTGASSTMLGQGIDIFLPASEFTKAELEIEYASSETPGFMGLAFNLGDIDLTESDYLIIDDVELVYDVASLSDKEMTQIIGSNIVTSSLYLKESVEEINVYNTSGMQVLTGSNTQTADFSSLPEGLYMVTLKKGNSMGTMKVFKN